MIAPEFPDFRQLELEDKDEYQKLISQYPPFSDIQFSTLHIWWNLGGKLAVCRLNANLVFNYNLPDDKEHSGWGLVGVNKIDESIQAIFEYLTSRGRRPRLVNVPEFTIERIANKDEFNITREADFDEYIVSAQQLAKLDGHDHSRTRRKVSRFLRETDGREISVKELDLDDQPNKELVYSAIERWRPERIAQADPDAVEMKAITNSINQSRHLDTRNLVLFVDGELQGIALYHPSHDNQHYIVTHLKVDYAIPHIFDYMTKVVAEKAVEDGVPFLNLEMDLGLEGLRRHKMGLRPVKFYRKFIVEPKS